MDYMLLVYAAIFAGLFILGSIIYFGIRRSS